MSQQGQQGNVFIGPFTVTIEHFKTDHCIRNSFFSGQALKGSPNLLLLCHSIGCRVLGAKFYHVGFYKNIIIAKQRNGPIGTVNLVWLPQYTKFANMEKN
mgnify:CR=1 FL=1